MTFVRNLYCSVHRIPPSEYGCPDSLQTRYAEEQVRIEQFPVCPRRLESSLFARRVTYFLQHRDIITIHRRVFSTIPGSSYVFMFHVVETANHLYERTIQTTYIPHLRRRLTKRHIARHVRRERWSSIQILRTKINSFTVLEFVRLFLDTHTTSLHCSSFPNAFIPPTVVLTSLYSSSYAAPVTTAPFTHASLRLLYAALNRDTITF
ncbi:hypothetical protein DL96DRAFT_1707409 [Flagelloscypha sp. PMI_526]|nr:hypothetical protein DL96DRAFT_1707409 [Flagelloscypha sp. PMI_526]